MTQQTQTRASKLGWRTAWSRWFPRALGLAVVALAAFLLYRTLSRYSLDEILSSMAAIPASRIALATLFAAASYLCLTMMDWLALRYAKKSLSYPYVALASFCSLSLGHNIGFAALSSGAIRYRFYSRRGVGIGDIAKVIVFCGATVGLGLMTLGGCAVLLAPDLASEIIGLPAITAIMIGIICLVLVAVYLGLAAFLRRTLHIRGHALQMPPLRLAAAQIGVGTLNFACVSACLYQVLAALGDVSYLAVAAAYVLAIASALISHVPGGLGVIEAVVLVLLPEGQFIGGLLAFRFIYFLVPLCLGGSLFAITELSINGRADANR